MAKEKYVKTKLGLKVAGIAVVGALLGGAGLAVITPTPTPVEVPNPINVDLVANNTQLKINQEGLVADLVTAKDKITALEAMEPLVTEVEVEVEKIVEVDSENLKEVLQHIYDNNGKVNYLLDDLDDDEISQIADRVIFINEIKELAIKEVKDEFVDEIDDEEFGTVTFDDDDIERVRPQDDMDEIEVLDVDFEDKDADLMMTVRFEQDDVKYEADVMIEIKDGEVDELDIEDIRER